MAVIGDMIDLLLVSTKQVDCVILKGLDMPMELDLEEPGLGLGEMSCH